MRRVLLVALGGTIACVPSRRGLVPRWRAADLAAAVAPPRGVRIAAADLLVRTTLGPADWLALASFLRARRDAHDGFVVTLGTDTMAWVGAALVLLLGAFDRSVVLTGAMTPLSHPRSDGRRNLRDALRVAAAGRPGVFVVFHGDVIAGDRASKTRSDAPGAFESIGWPRLGRARRGGLTWTATPATTAAPAMVATPPRLQTRVATLKLTPATSARDVVAFRRFRGLLVEGYGDGNVPDGLVAPLLALARNRLVVLASQCPYGSVHHRYAGGAALVRGGVLSAGDLTREAALVRLMWALGTTRDLAAARRRFAAHAPDGARG